MEREGKLYDTKIEDAVIGSLITDPQAYYRIDSVVTPDSFYWDGNKAIFSAIQRLIQNNEPIDLLTLKNSAEVKKSGISAAQLAKKTNDILSSVNIFEHCLLLEEFRIRREVSKQSETLLARISQGDDISTILAELTTGTDKILTSVAKGNQQQTLYNVSLKSRENLISRIKAYSDGGGVVGITTGLRKLNDMLGGFKSGELVILAGRPSMGKTAVMLHFALSAARSGKKALVFSLEMDGESLADRAILSMADVNSQRYATGCFSDEEVREVDNAVNIFYSLPLIIDDKPLQSLSYIDSVATNYSRQGDCDIIFVDYLGLIDHRKKDGNREQEVAEISKRLKALARKCGCPVILLSQLSRACEQRADKMPMLSDLRESGAIEQDADKVLFVFRPAYYGMTNSAGELIPNDCGELIVAKNRNGRTGSVKFSHNESLTRITDY